MVQMSNGLSTWIRIAIGLVGTTVAIMIFVWQSQAAQDARIEVNGGELKAIKQWQQNSEQTQQAILGELREIRKSIGTMQVDIGMVQATQAAQAADIRELKEDVRELKNR